MLTGRPCVLKQGHVIQRVRPPRPRGGVDRPAAATAAAAIFLQAAKHLPAPRLARVNHFTPSRRRRRSSGLGLLEWIIVHPCKLRRCQRWCRTRTRSRKVIKVEKGKVREGKTKLRYLGRENKDSKNRSRTAHKAEKNEITTGSCTRGRSTRTRQRDQVG